MSEAALRGGSLTLPAYVYRSFRPNLNWRVTSTMRFQA
jgi:hypothetical protein